MRVMVEHESDRATMGETMTWAEFDSLPRAGDRVDFEAKGGGHKPYTVKEVIWQQRISDESKEEMWRPLIVLRR